MLRSCESRLLELRLDVSRNNVVIVLARESIVFDWIVSNIVPQVVKGRGRLVIACYTRRQCEVLYTRVRSRVGADDVGIVYGLMDPEAKDHERRKRIIVTTHSTLLLLSQYLDEKSSVVLLDVENLFTNVRSRILFWSILTRLAIRQVPTTLVTAYVLDVEPLRKLLGYRKLEVHHLGDISTIGEITLVKAEYYTESLVDRVVEVASQNLGQNILIICDSLQYLEQFRQELEKLPQPTYIARFGKDIAKILNKHEAVTVLATSGAVRQRYPIDVAVIVVHSDKTWNEHKLLNMIKELWTSSKKLYIIYNNRDQAVRRIVENVVNLDIGDIYIPEECLDTYILYVTYPEMRYDQAIRHTLALPFLNVEPSKIHRTVREVLCPAKLVEFTEDEEIRHTRLGRVIVEQGFTVDDYFKIFNMFMNTRNEAGIPDPVRVLELCVEPTVSKYVDDASVGKVLENFRKRGLEPIIDPRLFAGIVLVVPEVVIEAYRHARLLYVMMIELGLNRKRKYVRMFEYFEKRIYRPLSILRYHVGKEIDSDLLSSIVSPLVQEAGASS